MIFKRELRACIFLRELRACVAFARLCSSVRGQKARQRGQLWYKLYTTQTPFVEKSEDKYGYHPGIKNSRELSSSG